MSTFRMARIIVWMAVAPCALQAQAVDLEIFKLPLPAPPVAVGAETGRAQPGVTAASPIAYGPKWGDFFAGGGYQLSTRYGGGQDGSVAVGGGLGDPQKYVGMEVVIASASTIRSGFGNRMYGSTKIHRILPNGAGIGLGLEGISLTGQAQSNPAMYLAYTQVQQLNEGDYFNAITWNGGVGNARFQAEDRLLEGKKGLGYFFSAAIRISPKMAAIADWGGQDLNIGMSFAPFRSLPITISPALVDVLGTAGDGIRFTVGGGISWSGVFAKKPTSAPPAVGVPARAAFNPPVVAQAPVAVTPVPEAKPETPPAAGAPTPTVTPAVPAMTPRYVRRVPAPERQDADGDGIEDAKDACGDSPSLGAVDANGCIAEIVPEEKINMANFNFGTSAILPKSNNRLDELANALKADPSLRVEVAGHGDIVGTDERNIIVSRQRAEAVKGYLVGRGVNPEQILIKPYGRSMPIAPNDTPENRAKNRRVELTRLP